MRCLSLCSGIGGIELGVSLVEALHPIAFVESNKYCQKVLKARWPGVAIHDDVTNFLAPQCDLLTAGFPCQPFSVAGKMKGMSDERWIWSHIERIVRDSRPSRIFLENVPPLVSSGGLAVILRSLAILGFDAVWGLLSCASLGAPHARRRLFILADSRNNRCAKSFRAARPKIPVASRHSGTLADANTTKPESRLEPIKKSESAGTHRPSFWPPGPNADWTGLQPWPSEPGVFRMADGVPNRLEQRGHYSARVRALGNAVSPPVAAVAWCELSRRIGDLQ